MFCVMSFDLFSRKQIRLPVTGNQSHEPNKIHDKDVDKSLKCN